MSGVVSRTTLLPCLGEKSMLMRETSMAVEARLTVKRVMTSPGNHTLEEESDKKRGGAKEHWKIGFKYINNEKVKSCMASRDVS